MPSTRTLGAAAVLAVGVAVFAYSVLVPLQPLLGSLFLLAAVPTALVVVGLVGARRALTWTLVALVVLLGLVVRRPFVGVVAACAVYLTSWLTGPSGPYGE